MYKQALTAGALFAMLAVILGAFGAHALKVRLTPEQLAAFETGVRYQFYHSFALIIAGVLYASFPARQIKLATTFFVIGILCFSGSLYAMTALALSGGSIGAGGVITPIGGLFFILGWLFTFLAIVKKK
jgi:uncharacterized membrane protein YgdD (TMEM256/DUF423 family)